MQPTVHEALAFGRAELSASMSPDVDVQLLICHVLQCNPTRLHVSPESELAEEQWQQFSQLIERRKHGEPVAHLTGSRGFWTLDLLVDNSTLIPRPDTELLVSLALSKIQSDMRVIDLGTGSGAIALSLAAERADIDVIATDYCLAALQLAQTNADRHQLAHVRFINMSWLAGFKSASFDLVVSNPPYIETDDPHLVNGDVQFEPLSALVSGNDGLDAIRQIVVQAATCLKQQGWLLVEHGFDQSERVQQLFAAAGFEQISAHQDFGGQDRAVIGQLTL